jgi:hypothetical protein
MAFRRGLSPVMPFSYAKRVGPYSPYGVERRHSWLRLLPRWLWARPLLMTLSHVRFVGHCAVFPPIWAVRLAATFS